MISPKKWVWLIVLFVFLMEAGVVAQEKGTVVYFNDFEGAVGPEWSNTSTSMTPAGSRQFLGQFWRDVSLTLDGLPLHTEVTVSFDLFLIRTWDGNNRRWGPDIWDLSVAGGPTLLHTTFSNVARPIFTNSNNQAYPDTYPYGNHPPFTGAAETYTLGYKHREERGREVVFLPSDSVYQLSFTFLHSDSSVVLNFSGSGLTDESWGLDNVEVSIPPPDALRISASVTKVSLEEMIAEVRVQNVEDLFGFQFDLHFDPQILEAVQIDEGDFLTSIGGSTFWTPPQIDNNAGRLTGTLDARLTPGSVSGDGTLATITFKIKKAGKSPLQLTNVKLSNEPGDQIAIYVEQCEHRSPCLCNPESHPTNRRRVHRRRVTGA
jgi:hypothetical protein